MKLGNGKHRFNMTFENIYNLSEDELYKLIRELEVTTVKQIEQKYDRFSFSVVYLPFIYAYLKNTAAETLRALNAIERKALQKHIIDKVLNDVRVLTSNSIGVSYKVGEVLSYSRLKKRVPETILKEKFKWSSQNEIQKYVGRRIHGLTLSQRVWNLQAGMIEQIEATLQLGILEGKAANSISTDLKKYLKEPDKLFRRVRDEKGNLKLSKNASNYHPGQGVYRSSFKNARRLAANEINKSYRYAQWETWQNLDFVVGQEIRRSNHVYDCDVCESLKGRYPKDFKFSGFHVQCRCYVIPILSTQKELLDSINDDSPVRSKNEIKSFPGNFHKWVEDNKHRYKPNTNDWIDENPIVKKMFYN